MEASGFMENSLCTNTGVDVPGDTGKPEAGLCPLGAFLVRLDSALLQPLSGQPPGTLPEAPTPRAFLAKDKEWDVPAGAVGALAGKF